MLAYLLVRIVFLTFGLLDLGGFFADFRGDRLPMKIPQHRPSQREGWRNEGQLADSHRIFAMEKSL